MSVRVLVNLFDLQRGHDALVEVLMHTTVVCHIVSLRGLRIELQKHWVSQQNLLYHGNRKLEDSLEYEVVEMGHSQHHCVEMDGCLDMPC